MGPWPAAHRCKCEACGGFLDPFSDPAKRCRCQAMPTAGRSMAYVEDAGYVAQDDSGGLD